ncbi:lytic polysaccharide monooxygenase, partial [Vibrio anguillarum]
NATAPHNPSYWEFYLSKPTYTGEAPLTWDDLDLIDTKGNVTVGTDKKYRIKITLPADRSGDAVLYTRWQRIDAAGEGFYNCSD